MRITKEVPKPVFVPITIVLETAVEAETLWNKLCSALNDRYTPTPLYNKDTSYALLNALSDVYSPK